MVKYNFLLLILHRTALVTFTEYIGGWLLTTLEELKPLLSSDSQREQIFPEFFVPCRVTHCSQLCLSDNSSKNLQKQFISTCYRETRSSGVVFACYGARTVLILGAFRTLLINVYRQHRLLHTMVQCQLVYNLYDEKIRLSESSLQQTLTDILTMLTVG